MSKGGVLYLNRGTYTISNTLFVPSNVKIVFRNGVVIRKGTKTGVRGWSASRSIFQLAAPSKSKSKGVYGKYSGVHHITFEGQGSVVIDLMYLKDNHVILAGHNQNLTIRNITFQNMNEGHFVELDANLNTVIEKCRFRNSKGALVKEAINIDTPDKATKGWNQPWSKFDKTENKNVIIRNCTFTNLGHAVGTHKYSYGHPHTNVQILNNTMTGIKQEGVRMMNWKNTIIRNNTISGTGIKGTTTNDAKQPIIGRGVSYPVIENNHFSNFTSYVLYFKQGINNGGGSSYAPVYNYFTESNYKSMESNTFTKIDSKRIYINDLGKAGVKKYIDLN